MSDFTISDLILNPKCQKQIIKFVHQFRDRAEICELTVNYTITR